MTPYQFYMVKEFPEFTPERRRISNQVQMTITGVSEKVQTTVSPSRSPTVANFERLDIETGVRHEVFGYTNFIIDGRLERRDFSEFIREVEFPAYLDRQRRVLFMKANHKVASGFLSNIRQGGTGIELADAEIDFARVSELFPRCLGAWFKDPSPRVKSAGLSGDQLQNDLLFKKLQKLGKISSLSMEFPFDHTFHPIILGKRGAVVLIKNYQKVRTLESNLMAAIFDDLVSKTWTERTTGKKDLSPPTIIDPDYPG